MLAVPITLQLHGERKPKEFQSQGFFDVEIVGYRLTSGSLLAPREAYCCWTC